MPNLDIKEQVPGAMPVVTIRGVGLDDFSATNSPTAGVYVDEVYVASLAMMAFDIFDLERIEVLKGPQGTLYGRNSTAGALNIITAQAEAGFRSVRDAGYGNYETFDVEGAVNVPLADTAGAALRRQDDPAGRRLLGEPAGCPGETIGERDLTGPAAARAGAGDELRLNFKVEGTRSRSEMGQPEFFGTVNPLTGGTCAPILAGRIDNTQCTDFLGYTDTDGDPFKGDWTREGVYDIDSTARHADARTAISAQRRSPRHRLRRLRAHLRHRRRRDAGARVRIPRDDEIKQFSQELRLAGERRAARLARRRLLLEGRSGGDTPGGHEDLFVDATLINADQDTKSAAGFANGEWHLTDSLDLVTGLRYTWEERHYVGGTTD